MKKNGKNSGVRKSKNIIIRCRWKTSVFVKTSPGQDGRPRNTIDRRTITKTNQKTLRLFITKTRKSKNSKEGVISYQL